MTLDEAIEECRGLAVDYALAAGYHAEADILAQEAPTARTLARSVVTRRRYDLTHALLKAGLDRLADLPGGRYFADQIRLKASLNADLAQAIASRRALAAIASTAEAA